MTRWLGRDGSRLGSAAVSYLALPLVVLLVVTGWLFSKQFTTDVLRTAVDAHRPLSAQRANDVGPVSVRRPVSFLLVLKDRDTKKEAATLAALYRPHSSTFGQYRTPKEMGALHGPAPHAVGSVRTWLQQRGLTPHWQPGNRWMTVSGLAGAVERTFHVSIDNYVSAGGTHYYAGSRIPAVPAALRAVVKSIGPISNYARGSVASVPGDGLSPTDLLAAYQMTPLSQDQHLDGSGETVAFVEIDGYDPNDLNEYAKKFNLPPFDVKVVSGPSLQPGDETPMDLEVVHAIAPMAKLRVYNCASPCTSADFASSLSQAVRDNPNSAISISLIICGSILASAENDAVKNAEDQAAAARDSVFVSSGDSGAYMCLTRDWPAPPSQDFVGVNGWSDPGSVTSVGGTRLSVTSKGDRYAEQVWENTGETTGGGGGVSTVYPIPDFQKGVQDTTSNPSGMRQQPDVSADADPVSGASILVSGSWEMGGGTSQAAPIWAGMTALFNQYLKGKGLPAAGWMNPALYALAAGNPAHQPFYDVTVGTNLVYPAKTGYDLATGLGTPNAWNLLQDLEAYLRNGGAG